MPVYKNKKNGTWFCKFYYKDWKGVQKQKWKRGFATKKEAQKFERNFLEQQAPNPDIIFENLYQSYLSEMKTRLKPSTVIIKKSICESKILPFFKCKQVNEITASDVRKWQDTLINSPKNYSETYLKTVNNQLSAIINYARKYYNLSTNPCEQAGSIGTSCSDEMQYWTLDEFLEFRKGLRKKKKMDLCFQMLYWTGMRVGELLALTEKDVDLARHEIKIEKTYQRLQGRDMVTAPKTKRSKRRVLIPDFLCEELAEYIEVYSHSADERLFPYTRAVLTYEMQQCCKRTNVKKIRIHDLRHSHVSLLIDQGFSALVIAERVGHNQVSTTLNTYAHLFPNKQAALASSLDKLWKHTSGPEDRRQNTCGKAVAK